MIYETSLFGTIESLSSIKPNNSDTHSLIITFPEAKVTVVDWDPVEYDLKISSFHFYEFSEGIQYEDDLKVNNFFFF